MYYLLIWYYYICCPIFLPMIRWFPQPASWHWAFLSWLFILKQLSFFHLLNSHRTCLQHLSNSLKLSFRHQTHFQMALSKGPGERQSHPQVIDSSYFLCSPLQTRWLDKPLIRWGSNIWATYEQTRSRSQ